MGQHKQSQTSSFLAFYPIRTFLLLLSLIVMSTDVIQAKVLESKTFDSEYGKFEVWLNDNIFISDYPYITIWYDDAINDKVDVAVVFAFNKVHYDICDDTGKVATQLNYKQIGLATEKDGKDVFFSELYQPVCDYVEQLLIKYDTNIEIEDHYYFGQLSHHNDLRNSLTRLGWLESTQGSYTAKYGKIYGTGDIDTEDGPYRVYMHNTDDNDKNFEVVSIVNKDGSIRHRVTSVIAFTLKTDKRISDYEEGIYRIDIADPDGRGHVICNKELWETLVKLSQTTDYNNAYKLFDKHAVIHDADPETGEIINLNVYEPN